MAAYILDNSLSKPKFRADICRPVDALKLFHHSKWDELVVIGEVGINAVRELGAEPEQYQIIRNEEEMHRVQDCAVIHREGADPFTWAAIATAVSIGSTIYAYVAAKNIKTPGNINRTQESANNRIQARENDARVNERVEYICGQVRSFPAKMANEYIVIENNEQVEYGYYSVGEGNHLLEDVRDGKTLGRSMNGWSLGAYRPFESPMNASPYLTIGSPITEGVRTTFQSDEAVRDEIDPPNDLSLALDVLLTGSGTTGTVVISNPPQDFDFNDYYQVGDDLSFSNVYATGTLSVETIYYTLLTEQLSADIQTYDRTDISTVQYEILSITNNQLTVLIPTTNQDIYDAWQILSDTPISRDDFATLDWNPEFNKIIHVKGTELPPASGNSYTWVDSGDSYTTSSYDSSFNGSLSRVSSAVLGPYAGQSGISKIQYNLLSDGLYKDPGKNAVAPITIEGRCVVREIDENGITTGNSIESPWSLSSNQDNNRKQTGDTFYVTVPYQDYTVEFVRDTDRDFDYNGNVVDVVELTELYFVRDEPAGAHYGNKTTIQTRRKQSTFGVGRAQKINMLATRQYDDGAGLFASRYFDDALYFMAINNRFGRRVQSQAEKMRTHLRSIRDELVAYFGSEEAAYFDFTFDSQDITFEEAVNQIAKACFCTAYQIGSDIKFFPDTLQLVDAMVFSHANKAVGKQTMKISFTDLQDKGYDCVEVKWRNPAKLDSQESIFVPAQNPNPKSIELVGIRSEKKAEVHAWREWYRIQTQRFSYECLVGLEATHLVPGRRVGIVNNTAGVSKDGYVTAWNGADRIKTSQEVDVTDGSYSIVMSTPTGATEYFEVTQGRDLYELVLSRTPSFYVNTNWKENPSYFRVAKDEELNRDSYAVQEVSLKDKGISIKAVNFSEDVYQKDDLMAI